MMKTCTKCGEVKDFSEFYKSVAKKDGCISQCIQCSKDRKKNLKNDDVLKLQKEIRSSIIIENRFLIKNGQKICSCCRKIYTLRPFSKNQNKCLDCNNKDSREWYKKNIEKRKEYRENTKDYLKQYALNNNEKIKEYRKQYRLKKKLEKEQQILSSK